MKFHQLIYMMKTVKMTEKVVEYINERLFTEEKPVVFTDLVFQFKVGPSKAKALMYTYYKQNTTTKFNCIIVCVFQNGSVRVVHDVNNIEDQDSLVDCFIYAFNPMEVFTPVSIARDQHDCLTIKNPYELQVVTKRSKTVEAEPTEKQTSVPVSRSRTVPERRGTSKKPVKAKETGLKSTAILAKMRGERESKEKTRQEELKKRRQEQLEQETKKDKKRSPQMEELNSMFDEESDEDMTKDETPATEVEVQKTPERPKSTSIDQEEIENLLETTAEDSLMTNNEKQEPNSSYVDEDGYIVTNRAATSTPPPPKKRPQPASKTDVPVKKRASKTKKTQGTLESFFKKR